jgi:hypothetical protein
MRRIASPENVSAVPGGDFYTTLSRATPIETGTPQGGRSLVTSLPVPTYGGIHTLPVAMTGVRPRAAHAATTNLGDEFSDHIERQSRDPVAPDD